MRWLRYGADAERLVEQALERDRWGAEEWQRWRQERLRFVLGRAAAAVPYYRDQWQIRSREGEGHSFEDLENWPLLEKEPLRRGPRRFVADDCDPDRMVHDHTSGTTGTSLDLWFRPATVRAWYALFEARCRRWYGVTRHDRWAIVGGQLVVPVAERRPPFWVWNSGLNQLYVSAYHLAPDLVAHTLEAIRRHRVTFLLGYSSGLHALAQGVLRSGRRDLDLHVVVTNAEPLFAHQREAMAEAFRCPVRETYGMAELVAAASECEAGRMHLWPEAGIVEVMENRSAAPRGAVGDLICTGLLNADMPLVRYRVGDRGALPATDEACGCGRTLPLLAAVEGRIDDVLYTRDGRAVGRLDPVFKASLAVREAQIIQESLDEVRLRIVPAAEYTAGAGDSLAGRLRERLGSSIRVIVEPVAEIPRAANGKFRAVVCNLPEAVRRSVGAK